MSAAPQIPEPLSSGRCVEVCHSKAIAGPEGLAEWLAHSGVDTSKWGEGDTKDVAMYFKEIKADEAGLELWMRADGTRHPVRVTHVLRAKVTSPEHYKRNIFLFNTWQQFADGRKRTRNGLLSEKLSTSEMPFLDHIREICERAVTEEEMQRLVESAFRLGPGSTVPEYDGSYVCPIRVLTTHFVDHTIEVEESKSYPGLLTMYHLYTVDIVCSNLPSVDFNTLEFHHTESSSKRKLKYVHAWVWLEWSQIQRYLFEGSELKERKSRGSFASPEALRRYLSQFDLDLAEWGQGTKRSIKELHNELERGWTQLELWGRHDGVPLLMRVVHVLQLQVCSTDPRLGGKFLLQRWVQARDGQMRCINRLLASKLSPAGLPFNEAGFCAAARTAVSDQLTYLADAHFHLDPKARLRRGDLDQSGVWVRSVSYTGHRHEVEESPTFKGLYTMYHLYRVEAACEELPMADFTSISFSAGGEGCDRRSSQGDGRPTISGWHWATWEETLDILHARHATLERRDNFRLRGLEASVETVHTLRVALGLLAPTGPDRSQEFDDVQVLSLQLYRQLLALRGSNELGGKDELARMFPPSMISKMANQTLALDSLADQVDVLGARIQGVGYPSRPANDGEAFIAGVNHTECCSSLLFCGTPAPAPAPTTP